MDSVTGSQMAKAMALEGGIGFVHRGMPIAAQVESVPLVKRTHSYVVEQPLCLPLHRIRGHLRAAVSYTGEETLVAARAKVLPDPLQYLIPLSPAAQAESYKR